MSPIKSKHKSQSDDNGKTKITKNCTPQPSSQLKHQKKFGQGNQGHQDKEAKIHTKECFNLTKEIR